MTMSGMTKIAAIIGGGVIGGGWAARFLLNGWDVQVFDPDPEAARKIGEVLDNARRSLPGLTDVALPAEGSLSFHGSIAEAGINFVDTAEMYPVNPVSAETVGRTEEVIGLWFEKTKRRSDMILATKHSGEGLGIVRDGAPISSKTIAKTIEGSLRRLKTDYIDLYQFHWPNRGSYMFRKNWTYTPSGQDRAETRAHMEDAMGALQQSRGKNLYAPAQAPVKIPAPFY